MTFGSPNRHGRRAGKARRPLGRRDRRGRGLRGQLLPSSVPAARSRAQLFDELVIDSIEQLEERWSKQLRQVEFAVEDVPPELPTYDSDILEDGNVPLARLLPGRPSSAGNSASSARVVIYRWPLEARAYSKTTLAELIRGVLIEQVAKLLGIDPDEIEE